MCVCVGKSKGLGLGVVHMQRQGEEGGARVRVCGLIMMAVTPAASASNVYDVLSYVLADSLPLSEAL